MPKKKTYIDMEIVAAIQSGKKKIEDRMISWLWHESPLRTNAESYFRNQKINSSDIDELTHLSFVKLISSLQRKKFEFRSSIATYHQGICRNLLLKRFNALKKEPKIEYTDNITTSGNLLTETPSFFNEDKDQLLKTAFEDILNQLDHKCRKILKNLIQEKSMNEIAKASGFSNIQSAKNAAYRCRKRLRIFIEQNEGLLAYIKSLL